MEHPVQCIRPNKICVFTVTWPTLILALTLNFFLGTFSVKSLRNPILAFQYNSFWCLRDHYFDKNELNVTLEV